MAISKRYESCLIKNHSAKFACRCPDHRQTASVLKANPVNYRVKHKYT
jgi:hypothetical protein